MKRVMYILEGILILGVLLVGLLLGMAWTSLNNDRRRLRQSQRMKLVNI